MILIQVTLFVVAILLIFNIILTLKTKKKESGNELNEIKFSITALFQNLKDTESNLKGEFVTNRKESAEMAKDLRGEIGNQLNAFIKIFSRQLGNLTKSNEEKQHPVAALLSLSKYLPSWQVFRPGGCSVKIKTTRRDWCFLH